MYFTTVCLGSRHQTLAGILYTGTNVAPSCSICCRRLSRHMTTSNSAAVLSRYQRQAHGGVGRTADGKRGRGRCPSVATDSSSRSAGESLRWARGRRQCYHHWSPPKSKNDTSLNLPPLPAPPGTTQDTHQQEEQQQQRHLRPHSPPMRSPQAVAMDEFAALERKLASPLTRQQQPSEKSKTPEQIAMEEFASLERKLGSAATTSASSRQKNGPRKVSSSSVSKPEVSSVGACPQGNNTPPMLHRNKPSPSCWYVL